MDRKPLDIGVVTDEVSPHLHEALSVSRSWGLSRFELREGSEGRFPDFTRTEVRLIEDVLREGAVISAVSPGILKGPPEDQERLDHELEHTLPRALEQAVRFECPCIVVFGFARHEQDDAHRATVQQSFEQVAEQAAEAGLTVAIENEPEFWVDRAPETVALLREIDHPALSVNWDPANLHWGGKRPDRDDFDALKPYIANVHVKDYTPDDPDTPWRPVGEGITPWAEILSWIAADTDLEHVTLETHCPPLIKNSRSSVHELRRLIARLDLPTEEGR